MTREGDTVLIEATEPVAYSVSRPDALSLVVDMRNVSVADARADIARRGRDHRRAAGTGDGGGRPGARARARRLAKPSEYTVRSARNTIRVELKGAAPRRQRFAVTTKAERRSSRHDRRPCRRRRRAASAGSAADACCLSRASNAGAPAPERGDDHRADQVQQDTRRRRPSRSSATASSRRPASPKARTARAGWSSISRT